MQHSTIANVTISEQYEALVLKDIVQVEHVLRQYINGTAEIVTEKNALGDTYRRMVGKQEVTYTPQEIEAVQTAAHTIKSAMI